MPTRILLNVHSTKLHVQHVVVWLQVQWPIVHAECTALQYETLMGFIFENLASPSWVQAPPRRPPPPTRQLARCDTVLPNRVSQPCVTQCWSTTYRNGQHCVMDVGCVLQRAAWSSV